jgi:hypothetical protein
MPPTAPDVMHSAHDMTPEQFNFEKVGLLRDLFATPCREMLECYFTDFRGNR